ncbi:MAG: amidohydrolase family protein [Thermodesulfobacteriota bacterium]|nr:amidohydrolase family protein [Thermodesulfobacteriota bacterium]
MIIDAHTHIFPDEVRQSRSNYFEGEGAFKLLYESDKARLAGADDLVACMDEQAVDKAVTFGFPWQQPDYVKRHNDYIIESQIRYPGRLIGFCCVDMYGPEPAREVERCLDAGLAGVGELAYYLAGIDEEAIKRLAPIMDICRSADKPVMLHTNEPVGHVYPGKTPVTMKQIYNLALAFPDNRIILAHWGGGIFFFKLLKKDVKDVLKNIWFDSAASPYLYDKAIYRVAGMLAGTDKILFGTDFPLLQPKRYLSEIEGADLSDREKAMFLGENAANLLGL